ncbi:MAG TPA: hypothetical protein VJV78_00880 [Polyangiales bacterium]|nr:hypothetical protein [Polyangiales bacterium]
MGDTRVSRIPDTELLDDELERLSEGRRARAEQRASLRVLETERAKLERVLDEASCEPDRGVWDRLRNWLSEPPPPPENDADLDRYLVRLGEIERESSLFVESLAASNDVDQRFTSAIERKHAWIASVPNHPAAAELERLSDERRGLQQELRELDHQLYRTADALGHVRRLVDTLDDADTLALLDGSVDEQPARVARARELAEQTVRSLKALSDGFADAAKRHDSEAASVAWLDAATSGVINDFVGVYSSSKAHRWLDAARDCLDRLESVEAGLKSRRRPLERRTAELTELYQTLVLQA